MKENEILEEIHRIREEHASECDYDIHNIFEQMRVNTDNADARAGGARF